MAEEFSIFTNPHSQMSAAALAGEYLRSFAGATRLIGEFNAFHEALGHLISSDTYLAGAAEIGDSLQSPAAIPDFDNLDSNETVISVSGAEGNAGYLKYRGRRDGEPFASEDLHLMGAIAGFVSVLTAQAQQFRQKDETARVFQFLLNQLPLGVVCFGAEGDLIVENKLATRLLGRSGADLMRGALSEKALKGEGKVRLHLEVDGQLLYTEGRRLEVDAGLSVTAFVLHDMSGQREKLMLQLERSVYRAESRGAPLTVAVLEDRFEAGRLYRELKASADSLQLDPASIASLDAYSCACIFTDKRLRSARYLLKNGLARSLDRKSVGGALVSQLNHRDDAPAQALIDAARATMQPLVELLRPAILVLDLYPAVIEALDLIADEISSFQQVGSIEQAVSHMQSGEFDGLFLDVDTFGDGGLDWLHEASAQAGPGFRVFYISHKQPSMIYSSYGLGVDTTVFQKPFDAAKLRETLALQFDFA